MNKIEEILNKHVTGWLEYYIDTPSSEVIEAMKEFGEACFNAGTKNGIKTADKRWLDKNKFLKPLLNYEDFLKEIENN